jgi:hypothetical protein
MRYTKEEDQIILANLRDVDRSVNRDVVKRCYFISDNLLPHRTADGIYDHWKYLIGVKRYIPKYARYISALDRAISLGMTHKSVRKYVHHD